jgi:hypothetical protein
MGDDGGCSLLVSYLGSVFFYREISPNFNLKKYDFDPYKGFFIKQKITQIHQISVIYLFIYLFKSPYFYDKFQWVARNIEGFYLFFFFYFHF